MAHALSVAGRVVLITGAAQGIGRVLAEAYAAEGATAVIADRDAERAEAVAAGIREAGHAASAVAVDVADEASVATMSHEVEAAHGRIDVLINNAAVFSTLTMQPFEEIDLAVWETVQRVNVTGAFLAARAVVRGMRARGFGRIINIASGAVTLGRPNYLHYIASKAALVGMTRSMAREVGADGITVNAVLPGSIDTGIPRATVSPEAQVAIIASQCIPRRQRPEDLIGIMLFLVSDGAAFLTGQAITVDGGATHP